MRFHGHLALAALAAAVLAGCGGGGGGGLPSANGPGSGGTGLQAAQSGDLVTYARARLRQGTTQGLSLAAIGAAAAPAAQDGTAGQAPQQESGVGEPDLLKTDGRHVHALHPWTSWESPPRPARLTSHRINADGSLTEIAASTLDPAFRAPDMHLAADIGRIAVIGEVDAAGNPVVQQSSQLTTVWPYRRRILLDVRPTPDQPAPAVVQRLEIDGHLVASRLVGNVLYLASTWMADLSRYQLPAGSTPSQVDAATAGLTAQELLPSVRFNGGTAQPLVNESDCLVQPANASSSFQLTTITAIDLGTGDLRRASRCFVGGTNAVYMTAQSLYLASSDTHGEEVFITVFPPRFPQSARTTLHRFALDGLGIEYRASGTVDGHLGWDREKAPLRLSEHAGYLRVLTYTGQTGWFGPASSTQPAAPSPATLTVLRENTGARSLEVVARLPNDRRSTPLGKPGEQVYGVRFLGPRAYVVTFRQTDPLYVLDLSDPADPKAVGELALPGFSDYLFPLDNGKLLGVGKEATAEGLLQGVKVALLDVADPAQPRTLSSVVLGERGSVSGLDYSRQAISLLTQGSQTSVTLPVRLFAQNRATVQGLARFEIDTGRGTLTERALAEATRFDGTGTDALRYAQFDLARERSLLTPQATYYLSGGQLRRVPQP